MFKLFEIPSRWNGVSILLGDYYHRNTHFHLFTHMLAGAKQFPATNSTHMLATATQNYCCYVPHCRHLRRYTQAPRFPFTLPPHCIRLSMLNAQFQSQNLTLPLQSMSIKANFYWRRQHQYCCCLLLMAAGVAALLLLLLLHFLLVCCSSLYKCACYYCYCIAYQGVFAASSSHSSCPPLRSSCLPPCYSSESSLCSFAYLTV